jgi:hypothetical protein
MIGMFIKPYVKSYQKYINFEGINEENIAFIREEIVMYKLKL